MRYFEKQSKLQTFKPAYLLRRDSNTGVFCEHCEIFKNTYSEVHLRTTASVFLKSKLHIIYILAENFIFSFRIYKIFSSLLSFANFSSTEFVFAFAFFSHTISSISPNISNVSFSSSLNRLNAFSHY